MDPVRKATEDQRVLAMPWRVRLLMILLLRPEKSVARTRGAGFSRAAEAAF